MSFLRNRKRQKPTFTSFAIANTGEDGSVRITRPHPSSEGDVQQVTIEWLKDGLALTVGWLSSIGSVTLPQRLVMTPAEARLLADQLRKAAEGAGR